MDTPGVPYGARIQQLAAERRGQIAVILARHDGSEGQLSWAELDDTSNQLARALARTAGVGRGDRLALKLQNSVELVLAAFAGWKLGATVIPIRWDLPDWELGRVLDVLRPSAILDSNNEVFAVCALEPTDALPTVVAPCGWGICSSGSTGVPKVIVRDVPGIVGLELTSTSLVRSVIDPSKPQRVLVPAPVYHTNGFMGLLNLLDGYPIVLMERFDAERALGLIESHHVTGFVAATPMLQRMAHVPDVAARDLSSVEWIQQGAAPIAPWLARTWIDLVGPDRMFFAYGATEGAGLVACTGTEWLEHPGTLGRGWNGTEIRVLDPDSGLELPPGGIGEIYVRNPASTVARYLGDVPQVMRTADGFATVGDLGWLDEQGWLYLADRRADLIVTGGANVFPAEVESALSEHPDVADVVVIGLADRDWGRRVHALVQLRQGAKPSPEAELVRFAKDRLAAHKVPKSVEIVEAIPRSAALKVNRSALVAARDLRNGPTGSSQNSSRASAMPRPQCKEQP